jgi:ubiquinone/menaquinone biosynthesis C-methylase UbiE
MDDSRVLERMRDDWNERASEDANYYVAFGARDQDEAEFFATGESVVRLLTAELKRLTSRGAALEIGCGPGRLMRPMSRHFGEIHGVDVSDRMIRLARERLRDTPNAHPHHGSGSDLGQFADETFDFVYSYAVFQHIPSRDVVFQYLREAWRVLKPGGILRCQLNGLPPHAKQYDTWSGVRITPDEVREFARAQNLQLLALEDIWTQYMWITCRKRGQTKIRNISNALTGEAAAPASGHLAALSLWIEHLPADCDLNDLEVRIEGRPGRLVYIGPPAADAVSQVNVTLPEGTRTGLARVEVHWRGAELCPASWVRILPPGPAIPRIVSVADGVNLVLSARTVSGCLKVSMRDVANAEQFRAAVDGHDVKGIDSFCTDPAKQTYEFNLTLPPEIGTGAHELRIALGTRAFAPVAIEVG